MITSKSFGSKNLISLRPEYLADEGENFSGKYKDKMAEIEAKRQQLPQNIRIRSTSRSKANGPNP
jgi:hypothetical protein